MSETAETRLKRLKMRSSRRGIKEMDLILGAYSHSELPKLQDPALDIYEDLLEESDHDLYQWVTGQMPTPDRYLSLIMKIAKHANRV